MSKYGAQYTFGKSTYFGGVPGPLPNDGEVLYWDGTNLKAAGSSFLYASDQLKAPDGSAGAPSYSFASGTTTGIYGGAGNMNFSMSGVLRHGFNAIGHYIYSDSALIAMGSSLDLYLYRDAANTLALRNGANAQEFRTYGTYIDASNFSRLAQFGLGDHHYILAEKAGTPVPPRLYIGTGSGGSHMYVQTGGSTRWLFHQSGDYFEPTTDNDCNLGQASYRWKDIYCGTDVHTQGLLVGRDAKTSAHTVAAGESLISCDASSAAFTVTLPAAASHTGRVIYIKKTDSSANAVTVDGNASETIDGALTQAIYLQYECLQLICTGTTWEVV